MCFLILHFDLHLSNERLIGFQRLEAIFWAKRSEHTSTRWPGQSIIIQKVQRYIRMRDTGSIQIEMVSEAAGTGPCNFTGSYTFWLDSNNIFLGVSVKDPLLFSNFVQSPKYLHSMVVLGSKTFCTLVRSNIIPTYRFRPSSQMLQFRTQNVFDF